MPSSISRITMTFALAAGVAATPLLPFKVSAAPQTSTQTTAKADKQENKKPAGKSGAQKGDAEDKQASANKTGQAGATQQSGTRTLSPNEDPSQIGKRNINKGIISKMSGGISKDVALGRQLAAEVDKQAKFIDDPVITEYVNRVGQNIVLHSDAKVPFTIKVIDSDEVNAFALPGGFFYVNKGLVLAAENEAEVAGVMAHEIAHVTARHAAENNTKAMLLQYGAIFGTIFTGGILGEVIYNSAGFLLPVSFLAFSRGAEQEADRFGLQYMYAAGYDPSAMSTMFEKLASQNKKKPGFFSRTFSTHPQTTDRIEASRTLVARFPEREEYVLSTSEFQRVKARLLRLSNSRASTAGDISGGKDDGTPGRPTLKRRQPAPDEQPSTGDPKGSDQKTDAPPTMRRRDGVPPVNPPDSSGKP